MNIILCSVFEQQQLFMNFMFFKELIELLNTRPIVPGKTADCLHLWETYTARQQEYIYTTIRAKLQDGKFVHYDPVKAIKENFPKPQIAIGNAFGGCLPAVLINF